MSEPVGGGRRSRLGSAPLRQARAVTLRVRAARGLPRRSRLVTVAALRAPAEVVQTRWALATRTRFS
jgi:hypothetical protein